MENNISKQLDLIMEKLNKIENDIKYLKQGTDNMTEHITFIDQVYDTVKNPFYYIMNKVKTIDTIPFKQITHK